MVPDAGTQCDPLYFKPFSVMDLMVQAGKSSLVLNFTAVSMCSKRIETAAFVSSI